MMNRREWLTHTAAGFGGLALASLLNDVPRAAGAVGARHHPATADSVIFLFMDGGPSQMDTFDPKPRLNREDGQPLPMQVKTSFPNSGKVLGSPFKFARHGECGAWVSELLPHTARQVDRLAVIRSMCHDQSNHANGCYIVHTGHMQPGRPSMGSWVTYGLGSECDDLPGYVVINGGTIPSGGTQNFGAGFLPTVHQGTVFRAGDDPIADVRRLESEARLQQEKLGLIRRLNELDAAEQGAADMLETTIRNYELAYRMQMAVPGIADISDESQATRRLYGIDEKPTDTFGRACLLARRMVERGVRFIQLTSPDVGFNRWDQHSKLVEGLQANALATDQPVAGLLADLAARGLLERTLVIWGGEFGRTPSAETKGGRDHNPFGFTMWVAGGGTKPGLTYGATDEYGYFAVENKVHIHDLHATMLHTLGVDHKRLTFRHAGRDFRLTDVAGRVVTGLLNAPGV